MNVFKMHQIVFGGGEPPQAGVATGGSVMPKREPQAWNPFSPGMARQRQRTVWLGCCLWVIACLGCSPQPARIPRSTSSPENPATENPATAQPLTWTTLTNGLEAAPLPKRVPAGRVRFESLSVGRTGIDFAHDWTPPPEYRLLDLPGGGICIGDYDGDGWPDVFLTQPNVGSRLYRNLGDFRFEDHARRS